jgi:hypothetical protein
MPTGEWKYRAQEGPSTYDNDGAVAHFNVPPREAWHILSVWAEYTASAEVTARAIRLIVRDLDDDVVMEIAPGVTVAASTQRDFLFAPGAPDLTAVRDTDLIMTPIPAGLILPPGWDISIQEQSSADTTDSDILITQLMYASINVLSSGVATQQSSDQIANTSTDLS